VKDVEDVVKNSTKTKLFSFTPRIWIEPMVEPFGWFERWNEYWLEPFLEHSP